MVLVHPWRVRAGKEAAALPTEGAEAWARFDVFFEEERERLFKALAPCQARVPRRRSIAASLA
jgi:hypothetical protein